MTQDCAWRGAWAWGPAGLPGLRGVLPPCSWRPVWNSTGCGRESFHCYYRTTQRVTERWVLTWGRFGCCLVGTRLDASLLPQAPFFSEGCACSACPPPPFRQQDGGDCAPGERFQPVFIWNQLGFPSPIRWLSIVLARVCPSAVCSGYGCEWGGPRGLTPRSPSLVEATDSQTRRVLVFAGGCVIEVSARHSGVSCVFLCTWWCQ